MFLSEKKVAPKQVQQSLFCVTTEKQVFGVADFVERLTGDYEDLWDNFREIVDPKPKEKLFSVLGSLHRFRIGKYSDKETAMQLV